MNSFILDSLNYYNKLEKLDSSDFKWNKNELYNLMPVVYIKQNNIYIKNIYNIIGIIDMENNIFHWAWSTNLPKYEHIKSDKLISYGVNIESKTLLDTLIKKILTSSKINIVNEFQSIYIMAIATYLTKVDRIIVIPNNNFMIYYGLYNINDDDDDDNNN